jgi:transposase
MKKPINTDDLVRGYLSGKSLNQLGEEFGFCWLTIRKMLVARGVIIRKTNSGIPSKQRTPDNVINRWIRDYLAGSSIHDIAVATGADAHTISDYLRKRNIQLRSRAEYTELGKRKVSDRLYPKQLVDAIIASYLSGKCVSEISKDTGVTVGVIFRWLKVRGITRSYSEASRLMYSQLTPKERKRFTAVANATNTGKPHPVRGLIRRANTRQRELTVASPTEAALCGALRGQG